MAAVIPVDPALPGAVEERHALVVALGLPVLRRDHGLQVVVIQILSVGLADKQLFLTADIAVREQRPYVLMRALEEGLISS